MMRLHYDGGTVIVSDRTGEALLDYALALARAGETAIARFPMSGAGDENHSARLLLGPASQLMAVDLDTAESDAATDDDAVEELTELARNVTAEHTHHYGSFMI